jgi:hypothetical protein
VRRAAPWLLAALLAIALAAPAGAAGASGELSPLAGSAWQADRAFAIEWDPIAPPDPTEAVYRLYDSQDHLVLAFRRFLPLMLKDIEVPEVPDAYTLEAWLKNGSGERGPPSFATLRFDNAAPAAPAIDAPPGWILGTEPAMVSVDGSAIPPPLSGIDGYAISVDGESDSSPCARPDRCLAGEIDVADGEGGVISLGYFPRAFTSSVP